jgi:hypothetical protein
MLGVAAEATFLDYVRCFRSVIFFMQKTQNRFVGAFHLVHFGKMSGIINIKRELFLQNALTSNEENKS